MIRKKLSLYVHLLRLNHNPFGTLLLLWPTLCALWLASNGHPQLHHVIIFTLGVFIMRSAGCVANDCADRNLDKFVSRTKNRPLTSGQVSLTEALCLLLILLLLACGLILFLHSWLLFYLSLGGLVFALIYPFLKRYTHLPQVGLGFAFSWGVIMAYAAEQQTVSTAAIEVFATFVIWPVIYDTMYAIADREDDLQIGIKSTAILFGKWDRQIIGLLQIIFLALWLHIVMRYQLGIFMYISLFIVTTLFCYQQYLLSFSQAEKALAAFANNNWVGYCLFGGIVLSYAG